jgi:hypothetical protein
MLSLEPCLMISAARRNNRIRGWTYFDIRADTGEDSLAWFLAEACEEVGWEMPVDVGGDLEPGFMISQELAGEKSNEVWTTQKHRVRDPKTNASARDRHGQ